MHILSWIMKHPIMTTLGLTALAILMNLGSGGHDKEGGQATKATTEAHAETAQVQAKEGDAAQGNAQQSADANAANVQPAAPAVAAGTESTVKPAVQAAVATAAVATVAATTNSAASAQQVVVSAQGSVTSQEAQAPAAAAIVASKAGASAPPKEAGVVVQDIASMASKDLLYKARNAFWQHKYDQSTEYYQELVNRDPESIEYRGELGNVFWHAGKEREAAAMYVQIAEPMIAAGRGQEVLNILGFIGAYFPDQAKELMDVIQK